MNFTSGSWVIADSLVNLLISAQRKREAEDYSLMFLTLK